MKPQAETQSPRLRPLPGLVAVFLIAALATVAQRLSGVQGLSPLILAMVAGIFWRNLGHVPPIFTPGIAFSMRQVLRIAIIFLGFQLSFWQLAEIGVHGGITIITTLIGTFFFTIFVGRLLGIEKGLSQLIAVGTSICGASAILAANSVTRNSDEDTAYAIACVTVFGSLSMILFPFFDGLIGLSNGDYGLWAGATIHEVAQAVAAAVQGGDVAGQTGTVAKLSRVLLLAPMILIMGLFHTRESGTSGGPTIPWFVFGFFAMALVGTALPGVETIRPAFAFLSTFLLTMAITAMGLQTDLSQLRAKGLRPLGLAALAWLFISGLGLFLILL